MNGLCIVVAGDRNTGKSSLILTTGTGTFPALVPQVLPSLQMDLHYNGNVKPVTIIDTSTSAQYFSHLHDSLKMADVVVLTCACDNPTTVGRLNTFWIPLLRRLEVKVPVVVVGCMLDRRVDAVSYEQLMQPLMQEFQQIVSYSECSAYTHAQIPEAFHCALRAVFDPTAPLFDKEAHALKPRCSGALKRIFVLSDKDRDGALSDEELNRFQDECFPTQLEPAENVRRVVEERLPEGVDERGITLAGFLCLQTYYIENGHPETTWTVLRKFGYNDNLRLRDSLLPPKSLELEDTQSVELSNEAVDYLRVIFATYDADGDGALRSNDIEDLFFTAPENPWSKAPYNDAAVKDVQGGLSLDGFLAQWALMTLLDSRLSVENLIYICYDLTPALAIKPKRDRRVDRVLQRSTRNVFQCYVFGPKEAGKTALLNSYIGRPFSEEYAPTREDRYAVNVVDQPGNTRKTLVLREIPEESVQEFLSSRKALAACDVAIFVYDSSCESSWKRAYKLLVDVARHAKDRDHEMPCLIVAAKDDLDPYLTEIQDSTMVSDYMGIEDPIRISTKLGHFNDIFSRIVNAADHPHLSIPGRSRERNNRLATRSLVGVSAVPVGVVAVFGLLAAYRFYAARKNRSG